MADASEFTTCPAGYTRGTPLSSTTCSEIISLWGHATGVVTCTAPGEYSCVASTSACTTNQTASITGNCSLNNTNPYCPTGNGPITLKDSGTTNDLCITPVIRNCPAGTQLNSDGSKCMGGAQIDCPADTGFIGTPINKCEAKPICGLGMFVSDNNQCYKGDQTCPLGNYSCKQIAGDTTMVKPGVPLEYCSMDPCQSDTSGWNKANDTQSGLNDKKNDGGHDSKGGCLGQIYLFNGNDMRCRAVDLNGMTESYAKLAGEIALAATGAGAALAGAMGATGAMATQIVEATVQVAMNTTLDAAFGNLNTTSLIQAGISVITAGVGGAAGASGLGDSVADAMASAGLKTGMTSLADPALDTIVQQIGNTVSQYSPAISQGMLGNYKATKCCHPDTLSASCTADEIKEATAAGNGLCHVVGRYCSSKMLFVCMVEKETSCCFSSKLGRIFHEQGRPQLAAFGKDGAWGEPRSPNCRGFTPEEFQSLDFSAIDLSEYEADLTARMDKVKPLVENYMGNVNSKMSDSLSTLKPPQ